MASTQRSRDSRSRPPRPQPCQPQRWPLSCGCQARGWAGVGSRQDKQSEKEWKEGGSRERGVGTTVGAPCFRAPQPPGAPTRMRTDRSPPHSGRRRRLRRGRRGPVLLQRGRGGEQRLTACPRHARIQGPRWSPSPQISQSPREKAKLRHVCEASQVPLRRRVGWAGFSPKTPSLPGPPQTAGASCPREGPAAALWSLSHALSPSRGTCVTPPRGLAPTALRTAAALRAPHWPCRARGELWNDLFWGVPSPSQAQPWPSSPGAEWRGCDGGGNRKTRASAQVAMGSCFPSGEGRQFPDDDENTALRDICPGRPDDGSKVRE